MRNWLGITGISILGFLIGQDLTSISVSLAKIQWNTTKTFSSTLWVIYIYLITITVLLPVFDRLKKNYDDRRLFLIGALAFTFGSFFVHRTSSTGLLFIARFIQGVGTAALLPLIWDWILRYFEEHKSQRIRPFILLSTLGIGVGPLVAAASMDSLEASRIDTYLFLWGLLGAALTQAPEPKNQTQDHAEVNYITSISLAAMLFFIIWLLLENSAWGLFSVPSLTCFAIAGLSGLYYVFSEFSAETPLYGLKHLIELSNMNRSILCFVTGWVSASILLSIPVYAIPMMDQQPFIVCITMLAFSFSVFIAFHLLRAIPELIPAELQTAVVYGGFASSALLLSLVDASSSLIFVSLALIPGGVALGLAMKLITGTNDTHVGAASCISSSSQLLINIISFGALCGTALSFALYKIFQKAYALEKISDGKLILPVDVSGSSTGMVQTIFDIANVEKLSGKIPYHTMEKLLAILHDAGTYGMQHLAWCLIMVCGLGFAMSFLIQTYFIKR